MAEKVRVAYATRAGSTAEVAQAARLPHPSPAACFAALAVTFFGGTPLLHFGFWV